MGEPLYIYGLNQTPTKKSSKQRVVQDVHIDKSDTDSRMTLKQLNKVRKIERAIYKNGTETSYVVDEKGEIVLQSENGNMSSVSLVFHDGRDYSNCVVTHNHPSITRDIQEKYIKAWGEYATTMFHPVVDSIATKVGIPFSSSDLFSTASRNLKGVRAVTEGGYIYSLERGKKGWPNAELLRIAFEEYFDDEYDKHRYYINEKGKSIQTQEERETKALISSRHRALMKVAEEFGLIYTRRKL